MKKAFVYCRVSSQRQVEEGHGLDGQEKRCRDFAKSQGYDVVKVFRDEGVSGGTIERDGMQALLSELEQYINDPEKCVVIIDDIKRFARDVQGHFTLKTAIYSRNAVLESPSYRFEDSPEGKFVETMLASAAELERNQNKRQVINRMKARFENGYWPFMPPLGLENKKDAVHGKILVPDEPYASILKTAIEKYGSGLLLTQDEVRKCMHDEFVKAGLPNRPAMSTTQKILENPLYAGYQEYEKWGIPFMKAKHEGFISIETFNLVQRRLRGRSKPWKRMDSTADFPLRTHVLCDACGKPMTASWNKGRSERYPNYFCRGADCVYRWKVVRKSKLETEFEAHLLSKKPANEDIDLAKLVFNERWNIALESHDEWKSKMEKESRESLDDIDWYIKRVRKTRDETLAETYEATIKTLKKKHQNAEQELNKKIYTSDEFGTASERVLNALKNPMSMWKSDDYTDKRTILYMYFEDKLRYDYEKGFGTASLAHPIKLISELGASKNPSVEMSGSEPESE
jgi:DNA invertase Pin-like site-specific DNA recombinase